MQNTTRFLRVSVHILICRIFLKIVEFAKLKLTNKDADNWEIKISEADNWEIIILEADNWEIIISEADNWEIII